MIPCIMTLEHAIDLIGDTFGNVDETIMDGLPDGNEPQWGYDERLIVEIGEAIEHWNDRRKHMS